MASSSRTCPSCGARVPADSDRCDLCGVSLVDADPEDVSPEDQGDDQGVEQTEESPSADASASGNEPESAAENDAGEDEQEVPATQAVPDNQDLSGAVFCNACGHENPGGANFCSQCGAQLDASAVPEGTRRVAANLPQGRGPSSSDAGNVQPDTESSEDEEQQLMSQQLLLTVGAAILVVVGLFFITLWSQNQTWSTNTEPSGGPGAAQTGQPGGPDGGPAAGNPSSTGARFGGQDIGTLIAQNGVDLDSDVQQRADSLQQQMENVDANVKRTLQEQLVNVYVGADAFGRASRLQQDMAEASGNPADWRRTGDLLYNWMEYVGRESNGRNPAIAPIGRRAIAAYENVLESEPDNHDVRTDMATVLLRSNDPMRGVEELNRVLDQDSTFVPARFNKGIALLWIGRYEQAIEEFEAVQDLAGEESPRYNQAARAIELVREEMNAQGSPASSSQPPVAPAG